MKTQSSSVLDTYLYGESNRSTIPTFRALAILSKLSRVGEYFSIIILLIVDFGTAITIDQVSADGVFRGGNISPGVQMRFRALHDYTAALPLCESCEDQTLLGRSTVEAIRQGVMNGIAFEIEGYIARLFPEIDALSIIFTGGDAKFFVKRIKNTIFAHCDLVFLGLNRILEYNASEESRR